MVDVGDLKPAKYNPRKWDQSAIDDLTASITKFGLVDPLIVNSNSKRKNIVIGGHFRLKVAKDMGFLSVPVIYLDIATAAEEKELNLRLNKNQGEWDFELLAEFDKDMLLGVGFEEEEIGRFFEDEVQEDEFDLDENMGTTIKAAKAKMGDVFQLGDHKLVCGDSTKAETYTALLGQEKADLVYTDPPYNVNYDYSKRYFDDRKKRTGVKWEPIFNDNRKPDEFQEFIYNTFSLAYDFSAKHAPFYCWYGYKSDIQFKMELMQAGWLVSQSLVWLKDNIVFATGQDYHRIYESCYFGWKKGEKHFVNKTFSKFKEVFSLGYEGFLDHLDAVYERRDASSDYIHPTQKPIRLAERGLKKHSKNGDIVLEMFTGSGSTLMACEQLGRKCRAIELDPRYVDAIIKRWEGYTGKKAKKVGEVEKAK